MIEQPIQAVDRKAIRIYLGSDALRAHSADILFSQNTMTLRGDERERLQVPFVRPEDENVFRNICTINMVPEKPKLNANAAPFVSGDFSQASQESIPDMEAPQPDYESRSEMSPMATEVVPDKRSSSRGSVSGAESERRSRGLTKGDQLGPKERAAEHSAPETSRREPLSGIWGSWRHGSGNGVDGPHRDGSLSGYQPAGRGRNMKVLKPQKSASRTVSSYDGSSSKGPGDGRRKSQVSVGENGGTPANRWEAKRAVSMSSEHKAQSQSQSLPPPSRDGRSANANTNNSLPRSANPVGVASAFSWMTPTSKPKTTAGSE